MYEKITFSNGIIDYFYSSDLHKINFICNEYGLNPDDYNDFQKAFEILRNKTI